MADGGTPAGFTALIAAERERWKSVLDLARVRPH